MTGFCKRKQLVGTFQLTLTCYCQSKLAVRERKCVGVGGSAVSDFIVTATRFRLLYCPRQCPFQSAIRKDKTVLYVFYGLPGWDVVFIGDGMDVPERSMLPEVGGSRFLRSDGTHLPYCTASRFRKPLSWYCDENLRSHVARYILCGYRQACVELRSCIDAERCRVQAYTYPSMLRYMH